MSEYVLLLRGGSTASSEQSSNEKEAILQRYRDWAIELSSKDSLVGAARLDDDGRHLVRTAKIQVDGPFTETHETIGGYYLIRAESMEDAKKIAQNCPIFLEGGTVEIREIQI